MPFSDIVPDIAALGGLPVFLVMSPLFAAASGEFWTVLLGMLGGLAACYGITACIRWCWFRPRPQPVQYHAWWQRLDASSFPSLHAMRAAFLGTVFCMLARWSWWALLITGVLTVAVAWTRVHSKRHRLVDVAAGIGMGVILAIIAMVLMVAVPTWF